MKIIIGKPNTCKYDKIEITAKHEAAHAVVALILGCTVKSIYLDDKNTGEGMSEIQNNPNGFMEDIALIACAGSIIENVNWITIGDFEGFKESGFKEKDLDKFFKSTKELVDQLLIPISLVADKLVKSKKLSGKQIVKIILKNHISLKQYLATEYT